MNSCIAAVFGTDQVTKTQRVESQLHQFNVCVKCKTSVIYKGIPSHANDRELAAVANHLESLESFEMTSLHT